MLGFSKQLHAFCSWFSSQYHTRLRDVSHYSPAVNTIMNFSTGHALGSEGITLSRLSKQPCASVPLEQALIPVLRPIPQH